MNSKASTIIHRPSANEWADHLHSVLSTNQLVRCENYPNDFRHIRFKDKPCPECELLRIADIGKAASNKTVIDNTRLDSRQLSATPATSPTTSRKRSFPTVSSPASGATTSGRRDFGLTVFLILLLLFLVALAIIFSNTNSPQSTSNAKITYPVKVYVPDAYESQNLAAIAKQSPTNYGKYDSAVNTALSTASEAVVIISSGQEIRKRAWMLVGVGWGPIKERANNDYRIAYWANYQALLLGYPEGASNLGLMHELGLGVPVDYQKAAYWYARTIELGQPHSAQAEIHLANLIQTGKLGNVDLLKARRLFDNAYYIADDPHWRESRAEFLAEIEAGRKENTRLENAKFAATAVAPQDKLVRSIQAELNRLGFRAGAEDGVAGVQTQNAIRSAQQVFDLRVNGQPSEALLNVLKVRKPAEPITKAAAVESANGTNSQLVNLNELAANIRDCLRVVVSVPLPKYGEPSNPTVRFRLSLNSDGILMSISVILSSGVKSFDDLVERGVRTC